MSPATHAQRPAHEIGLLPYLRKNRLNWLLLFVPVSLALALWHRETLGLWVFLASAAAIIPLAGLIGGATEEISERTGPGLGGFLNATFGNATELIISLFALRAGLHEVVKASISGSIIGNILLVLGASMCVGGWGRVKQQFSRVSAGASAAMLFLAVVALVLPAVFQLVATETGHKQLDIERFSLLVSLVLLLIYAASLLFTLRTHRDLIGGSHGEMPGTGPHLSMRNAILLLIGATLVTAVMAELLVGTIELATRMLGMTEFFVGVIVVAVVGNAAEHFSAVTLARKGKMDLAVTIATSSSTQIALFVAPVLVFASFLFGTPMSLVFNVFEIVGVAVSVLILALVTLDGESNWFEGLQLVAVYVILAIVFFFVPEVSGATVTGP